jgi:hypothetical protein
MTENFTTFIIVTGKMYIIFYYNILKFDTTGKSNFKF